MNEGRLHKIGLIIGREQDWPDAFMAEIKKRDTGAVAELLKIGGTFMNDMCPYSVIIDRMSHEIPYYRTYVKFAAVNGSFVINDPFVWSSDSRFFGTALVNKLGLLSPRTVALPNKDVDTEVVPDSFRNLEYPMDWEGIVNYVGVPAIFKEVTSGGRRLSYRVHNVDELIERYDMSGTHTMILQEVIEGGDHIHAFVVDQSKVLPLRFAQDFSRYEKDFVPESDAIHEQIIESAVALSRAYGYDINMVEYVHRDDELFVISGTNPAPMIDRKLMSEEQFDWLVQETVNLALARALKPLPQRVTFDLSTTSPSR